MKKKFLENSGELVFHSDANQKSGVKFRPVLFEDVLSKGQVDLSRSPLYDLLEKHIADLQQDSIPVRFVPSA